MSTVVGVGGKRLELPCPVAGYPIEGITWEKGTKFDLIHFSNFNYHLILLDGRRLPLNSRQRLYPFNGSLTIDPLDKSSDCRSIQLRSSRTK
jgi:hypothetical protein